LRATSRGKENHESGSLAKRQHERQSCGYSRADPHFVPSPNSPLESGK
jgi:hypothetical protein